MEYLFPKPKPPSKKAKAFLKIVFKNADVIETKILAVSEDVPELKVEIDTDWKWLYSREVGNKSFQSFFEFVSKKKTVIKEVVPIEVQVA